MHLRAAPQAWKKEADDPDVAISKYLSAVLRHNAAGLACHRAVNELRRGGAEAGHAEGWLREGQGGHRK